MDILWTPWRFAYVTSADGAPRPGIPARLKAFPGDTGCVFCNLIASIDFAIESGMSRDEAEAAGGLIFRGKHCFICLNAFPYTSGHVMVMPYAHLDRIAKMPEETAHELIDLAQQTERALEGQYHPHGFNFGLNLGQAAGAGVAGHLHMHAMPRWVGDTNFMTTVSETRVLPEDLETTWKRLRKVFREQGSGNRDQRPRSEIKHLEIGNRSLAPSLPRKSGAPGSARLGFWRLTRDGTNLPGTWRHNDDAIQPAGPLQRGVAGVAN